jgi:hypothetical protein
LCLALWGASTCWTTQLHAQGQVVWAVLPIAAEGIDPNVAATFHDLLESELSNATHGRFVGAFYPCPDAPCATAAAARLGAHVVVYGSLRPLGTKLIAAATAVDGRDGRVMASQTMSVDRVEELDMAAKRLAASLVSGIPARGNAESGSVTRGNAESGSVTQQEAKPDVRRDVITTVSLRMGGIVPLSNVGYAGLGTGIAFDFGIWIEGTHFALEPRIGLRFDTYAESRGAYWQLPIDFGAYYIFGQGDFAPIIGGGPGLHYLSETRYKNFQVGKTLATEHIGTVHDGGWGLGAHGRVGLLMFRTYKSRMMIMGDYNAAFVELNGGKFPQSLVFGLSLIF